MKLFKLLTVLALLYTLSGCGAHTKVARIDPDGKCPPGETCVSFMSSGMDAEGAGVQKATVLFGGTTVVPDKNGQPQSVPLGVKVVSTSANPDRLDVYVPAILGAAAQFGSAAIQADAIKYSARKQAGAMRYATDNNGPSSVFINQVEGSDSTAVNQQSTEVGIDLGQTVFDPRR